MEKIPAVPGFVLYRVDNKQLYYSNGSKWQAVSTKLEVSSENRARATATWPEITDIINILIRCEFAYHFKHGVICNTKLYYAML